MLSVSYVYKLTYEHNYAQWTFIDSSKKWTETSSLSYNQFHHPGRTWAFRAYLESLANLFESVVLNHKMLFALGLQPCAAK